jgi:glycosyltransferase involved in cell wall biosynthesis
MNPVLSVLIPSVPSRREMAWKLFDKISEQALDDDENVEVLLLLDNKTRSIGKKREALVQISKGDYVAFVDDDDDVAPDYVKELTIEAFLPGADVVVFPTTCTLNDGPTVTVEHDISYPNEQYSPAGFRRSAWQMHAWRGDLARATPFPDLNFGEDWPWCEAMLKHVKTQAKIDQVLYHYRYSDMITEASK